MHRSNLTAVLLGLGALGWANASIAREGTAPRDETVRCESRDGRLRECVADTRGGVQLVKQLSRSECRRGRSWGVSRDGVWVSDGCRADFVLGHGSGRRADRISGPSERTFRCESKDGRWKHCNVATDGPIELVRQLSRGTCLRNQTWGVDERGLWVSGGCRAEFRIALGGMHADPDGARVVRCESNDGRQEHCPVNTRGGVRLARQISRTACIEGHNWRFDRNGIWVKEGCRADFEVGYHLEGDGWFGRND